MRIFIMLCSVLVIMSASSCEKGLENTRWKVTEIRQANATKTDMPTKDYILEFKSDKSVGIKLDINNCFGSYEISDPNQIQFSPMGCTKACCDSEFANQFINLLQQVKSYTVAGKKLTLNGEGVIRLVQVE